MGAAVYQLGQLSHLMLLPLERICVTFSLNNINPCSVWKKAFDIRQRKSIQFGEVPLKEHIFFCLQGSSRGCCISSARVTRQQGEKAPTPSCFAIHWNQSSTRSSNISVLKAEVLGWYLMKGTVIDSLFKSALEEENPWWSKALFRLESEALEC